MSKDFCFMMFQFFYFSTVTDVWMSRAFGLLLLVLGMRVHSTSLA